MSCEIYFCATAIGIWATVFIVALMAITARNEHWKNRGYNLCIQCGKWRPKDEMYNSSVCCQCVDGLSIFILDNLNDYYDEEYYEE
jgi:hypothetical protein